MEGVWKTADFLVQVRSRISPLCDLFLIFFTSWTLLCNLAALSGKGLLDLVTAAAVAGAALSAILALWWVKKRKNATLETNSVLAREEILFWLITLTAVVLTMIAHRPDMDDAHFINWAVSALDQPELRILHFDGKINLPGTLEVHGIRKIQSFEIGAAALAWLAGEEPIVFFHLIIPPLAAVLVCLGLRLLLENLSPRHWIYAFTASMVFLCINGEIHRSYGNFCFVRLHQGKSIMLSAMIPMITVYGFWFGRNPSIPNWARLSASQICAIGLSVNALWLAPLTGLLSVGAASGFPIRNKGWKVFLLGMSSSFYVIGLGAWYAFSQPMAAHIRAVPDSGLAFLSSHFFKVFTFLPLSLLQLVIALTVWKFCRQGCLRRYFFLCLITVLAMANPFTARWTGTHITGSITYWRVFWLLPMSAMVGLVFISILRQGEMRLPFVSRNLLTCLLLIGLTFIGWNHNVFRQDNGTRIKVPPTLKVNKEFSLAMKLRDILPERANIIAPENITSWITTLLRHPYPLLSRNMHARLYGQEGYRRLLIKLYVSGKTRLPESPVILRQALKHYDISAVCLPENNNWAQEIRTVLDAGGFHHSFTEQRFEVWIKPDAD